VVYKISIANHWRGLVDPQSLVRRRLKRSLDQLMAPFYHAAAALNRGTPKHRLQYSGDGWQMTPT
jgi:hypothetical protein